MNRQRGSVRRSGCWSAWLAAMLLGTAAHAQLSQPGGNAIAAGLVAESATVPPGERHARAGDAAFTGLGRYWKNPGDGSVETRIAPLLGGRSGVPLYLYYQSGRPVEILPQVLTPARLVSMVSCRKEF